MKPAAGGHQLFEEITGLLHCPFRLPQNKFKQMTSATFTTWRGKKRKKRETRTRELEDEREKRRKSEVCMLGRHLIVYCSM